MTEQPTGKKMPPRLYYGINAAAFLTLCEIEARLAHQRTLCEEGFGDSAKIGQLSSRKTIEQIFLNYLRFIRNLKVE